MVDWGFTPEELDSAVKVVTTICNTDQLFSDPTLKNSGLFEWLNPRRDVRRHLKQNMKQANKKASREANRRRNIEDRIKIRNTEIRRQREAVRALLLTQTPEVLRITDGTETQLNSRRKCYICKEFYLNVHHFYCSLCPTCAEFNWQKRLQFRVMTGKTVLVTGGRVKIGYQICLSLLRNGATVIMTTRFIKDSFERYSSEGDFELWRDRLRVFQIDFRDLKSVDRLCDILLEEQVPLHALINNAAQTIARPHGAIESGDMYNYAVQLFDQRTQNSWRSRLHEVSGRETAEVFAINAIAPFILTSRLKPLLQKPSYVINVSAVEGQFNRDNKPIYHPHTNMAKASINMMTRTSAADYARDQIYMHSVDTGWVTDESPFAARERKREKDNFAPPLDEIDGAARVLDPIYTQTTTFGKFLKDYREEPW